jgi:transposase
MKGNFHVQFGIGGDGSDPIADHTKERSFAPLVQASLEALVPQDHFYRHVQTVLDLSFVYDLVRECYSMAGRPSIDPVVFWHR